MARERTGLYSIFGRYLDQNDAANNATPFTGFFEQKSALGDIRGLIYDWHGDSEINGIYISGKLLNFLKTYTDGSRIPAIRFEFEPFLGANDANVWRGKYFLANRDDTITVGPTLCQVVEVNLLISHGLNLPFMEYGRKDPTGKITHLRK